MKIFSAASLFGVIPEGLSAGLLSFHIACSPRLIKIIFTNIISAEGKNE